MSSLRLFLDYLWPPPLFSHPMVSSQQRDSPDSLSLLMNRHDIIQYTTQSLQGPVVVRHRTLRRKRAESVDYSRHPSPSASPDPYSSSQRQSPDPADTPHPSLRELRDRRRAEEPDPAPARGFGKRIHDLEVSYNEQRRLADERQHRVSVLEKENVDLRAKLDSSQKRLQVLQTANTSFAANVTKLERELQAARTQHASCKTRISSAESRYTTLLAANNVLQSSYNDLRSSHQALQSASTSAQLAHSALLFSTSTPYTPLPQPIPRRSTPPPPNSPIDQPTIPPVPPVPIPVPLPAPPKPQIQLKPKPLPLDVITPPAVSRESSTQTSPLSIGTSFSGSSGGSAASHVSRLKTLLNDRTSELNSLQAFLSKHDEWSGAQVVQAVEDLNGELARLASAVSEYFIVESDMDSECSGNAVVGTKSSPRLPNSRSGQETHDRLKDALGSHFYHLIFTCSDPPSDLSLLVQYAIQAWEVWCCSQILDGFCFGLPTEAEKLLTDVWESMKNEELQPMSSRWRGLTHEYIRRVLSAPTPRSPQLPTPPASPSISALYKSQSNEPLSVRTLRERELFELNVRGILSILSGVGLEVDYSSLPPSTRRSPTPGGDRSGTVSGKVINATKVVNEFGEALKRIQEQAMELARVTREGVMSGWFDITRVPGAAPISVPTQTSPVLPSQRAWTPPSVGTPQKGGRRATVAIPPRRTDSGSGDRRMSEPSLASPSSLPQTSPNPRNHERKGTRSPNLDRTPTHTPYLDHPRPSSSLSSYTSQTIPSTYPSLAKPRDAKVSVTKFDHRKMENVFQGYGKEDGECVVMCTIEFGLDCVRKVVTDEDLGVVFSPIEPVGPSPWGVPEEAVGEVDTMERKTLVKPKVLLENVVELMM